MSWDLKDGASGIFKMRTGRDYESYGFDDAYFEGLSDLMGVDTTTLDMPEFAYANCNLLMQYLKAVFDAKKSVTLEKETHELEKLQKIAGDLIERLGLISSVGNAGSRLYEEVSSFADTETTGESPNLRVLLGDEVLNPFEGLRVYMYQLQIAAERAKIQRPKQELTVEANTKGITSQREFTEQLLRQQALLHDRPDPRATYNKRRSEYAPRTKHAITVFIEGFEQFWSHYSPLLFTEGKFETDAHQHISPTIDAACFILNKFQTKHPRSLIEKKVRDVRETRIKNG